MPGFESLADTGDTIIAELQRPALAGARCQIEGTVVNHDFVTVDGARGYLLTVSRELRDGATVHDRIGREICVPYDLGTGDWAGRIRLLERGKRWRR